MRLSALVILLISFLPLLPSCRSREAKEVQNYFDQIKADETELKERIAGHFERTSYTFEIFRALGGGGALMEGPVSVSEFKGMQMTLFIRCFGASTFEKAEEVDKGLRAILSKEEYERASVRYSLEPARPNSFTSLEVLRMQKESRDRVEAETKALEKANKRKMEEMIEAHKKAMEEVDE